MIIWTIGKEQSCFLKKIGQVHKKNFDCNCPNWYLLNSNYPNYLFNFLFFSIRLAAATHAGEDLLPKGFNYDKINEIINTSITMPIEKNRFYQDLSK